MAGMKFGMFNLQTADLGEGPGGDTGSPKYTAGVFIPVLATIIADINAARAAGMTLFVNFASSRNTWCDPGPVVNNRNTLIYNPARYESNIRKFTVAGGATQAQSDAIVAGIADKTIVAYVVDEPFHQDFNDTISPEQVNAMGLLHKAIWPGIITCVRVDSKSLIDRPISGGWTGLDYGWSQYEGPHYPSYIPAQGRVQETPAVFYAREKADFATIDMGMIAGLNWLDGGFYNNFGALIACWDYANNGVSNGLVKGTFSGSSDPGTTYACALRPSNETRFMSNPQLVQAVADAIYADPDVPALVFWTHCTPQFSHRAVFEPYELRADIVAAFDYVANKLATRPTDNGWRTAKGAAPPATGTGLVRVGFAIAAGTTVALPAHQAGDLIIGFAWRTGDATIPSLPGGYTSMVGGNTGSKVSTRAGRKIAASGAETSGTWTNAHGCGVAIYRGILAAGPVGSVQALSDTSATLKFPAVTLVEPDGTSWVMTISAHELATNLEQVPAGLVVGADEGQGTMKDSNGGVTSFGQKQISVDASGVWRSHSFEIFADPAGTPPAANQAPVLAAIGAKSVTAEQLLTFTASGPDPDGHTVNYSLLPGFTAVPAGASINPTTGVFTWTPTRAQVGIYNIIVRSTDMVGQNPGFPFDEEQITITVNPIAQDPGPDLPPEVTTRGVTLYPRRTGKGQPCD